MRASRRTLSWARPLRRLREYASARRSAASPAISPSRASAGVISALQRPGPSRRFLALAGRDHPAAHRLRALPLLAGDLDRARLADRGEDVDPVGEGAAEAALVALDVQRRAGAVGVGLAAPARAGIRRRDQHESAGQAPGAAGAGDRDPARLEGRPQCLEGVATELAELVEEEDAAMGQGRLARPRRIAAADQTRRADRVMGSAERPPAQATVEPAAGARDPRDLERLDRRQRRQDRGQAGRRQRLPGPRRPDDQQAVPAGSGDLQRVAEVALPSQVGEVGSAEGRAHPQRQRRGSLGDRLTARELGELAEALDRDHLDAVDQRRLGAVGGGDDDQVLAGLAGGLGHRQRAMDRADRAVEGELADHRHPSLLRPADLAGGGQERRRHRQVEAGPGLADAGGCEVGDDPPQRELEPAVRDRRPHTLAGLPHGGVRQPHHGECGQAAPDVDLDPDRPGRDPVEGEGPRGGEHGAEVGRPRRASGTRRSISQ